MSSGGADKAGFSTLLTGRNLKRALSLQHRELMGDYLITHPLHLLVV
jgi:hypothetical protein